MKALLFYGQNQSDSQISVYLKALYSGIYFNKSNMPEPKHSKNTVVSALCKPLKY